MKGKKLVAVAAVCVAALGALAFWLLYSPTTPASGGTAAAGSPLVIHTGEVADIQTLIIHNQYGDFTVTAKDGGFQVHDIPPMLVDYPRFAGVMNGCANLTAQSRVENPASTAEYGLDKPQATVDITFGDGALALALGAKEPVSGGYYFSTNGGQDVYLMDGQLAENFLLPAKMFIDHRATPPLAGTTPLSAVLDAQFEGGELEVPLVVQAAASNANLAEKALSFGAVTHLVTRHDDYYEMDQTYGIEVLGSLLGIPAADVEAYNCTADQLTGYGFDTPWMTVEFDLQNTPENPIEHYRLQLVEADNGQYLLTVNDYGIVYRIGQLPFMGIDTGKLMLRWYLSPMLMDIAELAVTTPETQLAFAINGTDAASQTATLNGQPVDIESFRQFYKLVVSAANDAQPTTITTPEGEPLLRIEYRYKNTAKAPDVIEFYPGGSRKLLVVVNGNVMEFGMREMYLTRMYEACKALPAGAPFDINW